MSETPLTLDFPRFVIFQTIRSRRYSNYVRIRYVHQDGALQGFLCADAEESITPFTKFELQRGSTGSNLYHIRSCYNNKYLVIKQDTNGWWGVCDADEPEEDTSKSNSTLFQIVRTSIFANGPETYKIQRVFSVFPGQYRLPELRWAQASETANASYTNCIGNFPRSGESDYKFIDFQSIIQLPKHIALQSLDNSRYLLPDFDFRRYLQFTERNYTTEPYTWFETFTTNEGATRLKSMVTGLFWRRVTRLRQLPVLADSTDSTGQDTDTLFWPVLVSTSQEDTIIALASLRPPATDNRYCRRGRNDHAMLADETRITIRSQIRLIEAVRRREIYNVNFRPHHARKYGVENPIRDSKIVNNRTQNTVESSVRFQYSDMKSKTWSSTVSYTLNRSVSLQSRIPFIGSTGSVEIGETFQDSYSWGETLESSQGIDRGVDVECPPMTRTTVTMVASRVGFDVPFAYTQGDTLFNNSRILINKEDGVFSGITTVVTFDITEESLRNTTATESEFESNN